MKNITFKAINFNIFKHNENEQNLNGSKCLPLILFIFIVIIYFIFQIATQPKFMLNGEMWAEMADNYYKNAISSSILDNLLATDAGYIPFPQRLIAFIASSLNFPAISIPYFYTWSATIFTAMLVSTFCLSPFRKIIPNDFLRLLTCFIVLISVDFETRTFINFTYFSGFFIAIITALALNDDLEEFPWWVWLIPFLFLSKPAVMAALPALVFASFICKSSKFRFLTFVSIIVCISQIIRLILSASSGVMQQQDETIGLFTKIFVAFKYFIGFLGAFTMGPSLKAFGLPIFLWGGLVLIICIWVILFKKNRANSLIFVGLSLLFFSLLINSFALSTFWNLDMRMLNGFLINRTTIIGLNGTILVVCALIYSLSYKLFSRLSQKQFYFISSLLLFIWFCFTGLATFGNNISKESAARVINSQWLNMAAAIDANKKPLCVPINPWTKDVNWMYKVDCQLLNSSPSWEYGSVDVMNNATLDVNPPSNPIGKNLVSAAIVVKSLGTTSSFVQASMQIHLKTGGIVVLSGSRHVDLSGGLLMLTGKDIIAINNIASITMAFSVPAQVAKNDKDPDGAPGIAWMGN